MSCLYSRLRKSTGGNFIKKFEIETQFTRISSSKVAYTLRSSPTFLSFLLPSQSKKQKMLRIEKNHFISDEAIEVATMQTGLHLDKSGEGGFIWLI